MSSDQVKVLLAWLGITIILATVPIGIIFIERYRYDDCMKVGHTMTYCVLDIFK